MVDEAGKILHVEDVTVPESVIEILRDACSFSTMKKSFTWQNARLPFLYPISSLTSVTMNLAFACRRFYAFSPTHALLTPHDSVILSHSTITSLTSDQRRLGALKSPVCWPTAERRWMKYAWKSDNPQ